MARHIDAFDLKEKAEMMLTLAKSDIDANNILKTVHAVCASTFEVHHNLL